MTVESIVRERYAEGAGARQESLCCPVQYRPEMLDLLPQEIIEKDYGCGDPSRYARSGDTVVDLGSGGGKICYIAAQIVGAQGRVIGIDMTEDMLALAERYRAHMADKLGYSVVEFRKGYIQDIGDLVAPDSADLVISNCVLNLVAEQDRERLIQGVFSVLKPGGRVAISDIVSDAVVPQHLKDDPGLWSGCISGAFEKRAFLDAFSAAGFDNVVYDSFEEQAWQSIEGINFHSATLVAVKPGGSGCC